MVYSIVLGERGILQHVFTFLPGNWLLLGAVCKEWATVYASIADRQVHAVSLHGNDELVICCSRTTFYSAVVASPATVRLAQSCGLAIGVGEDLELLSGLHADIQTLEVLHKLGMPFTDELIKGAARSGRLNILQHLITERLCPVPQTASFHAARSGSISMIDWLRAGAYCVFDTRACAGAAWGGQLAALQHLHRVGCEWDEETIAGQAACAGSIEMVEWLRQQPGVVVSAETLAWAANSDQISMCKHLRSTCCDWDADACSDAASGGALGALRWLRENGCPWDSSEVFVSAARNGHTEILDYDARR
jgi:hypothetical protein